MSASPSGPIATSKKSSNTRLPELQSNPRLQMGPKCVMWSLACETVNTGSRALPLSDCANMTFQRRLEVFGIASCCQDRYTLKEDLHNLVGTQEHRPTEVGSKRWRSLITYIYEEQ